MQIEVKALGQVYNGRGTVRTGKTNKEYGSTYEINIHTLDLGGLYRWRVRFLYGSYTTPFMPASRWLTMPWNGRNELDFRAYGFRIYAPLVFKSP